MVSQVPLTTSEEFKSAVFAAKEAFPSWRNTPITARQRIMFKFQELIRKNMVSGLTSLNILLVSCVGTIDKKDWTLDVGQACLEYYHRTRKNFEGRSRRRVPRARLVLCVYSLFSYIWQ